MKGLYTLAALSLLTTTGMNAQLKTKKLDDVQFFEDKSVLAVTIEADLRQVMKNKMKEGQTFGAFFRAKLDEGPEVCEPVTLEVRGNFRKEYCYMPPLKINFKSAAAPVLSPLGSLKLVNECNLGGDNEQYLLKEYLVYKIYNLLTEKSLRARLLKISFTDTTGKKKPVSEYGFLLEDVKDMAKRNGCLERKRNVGHTELTDRKQMTRVALFEYMIGNLDWSVPVRHNIKLIVPKKDTTSLSFAVPYDFDHSGLVKTDYALPPPQLDLQDVTVRNYRGFVRSMNELQEMADEFLQQKEAIYGLIKEFDLLTDRTKEKMLSYLNDFFIALSKPKEIKAQFIENARKD